MNGKLGVGLLLNFAKSTNVVYMGMGYHDYGYGQSRLLHRPQDSLSFSTGVDNHSVLGCG